MIAASAQFMLSLALAMPSLSLPAAWRSDTLICKGAAFKAIETIAHSKNYTVVLDDQNAGVIVFSFRSEQLEREIYFQVVFRNSRNQPSKAFVTMSARTLDGAELPETAEEVLLSIQNALLSTASRGRCL